MGATAACRSSLKFGWTPVAKIQCDPAIDEILVAWEDGFISLDTPELDWKRMIETEKAGGYKVWTARKGKKLVALIEWHIFVPFHYRHSLLAVDGGHFKLPEVSIWQYSEMWKQSLMALRDMGVKTVRAHDNAATPMNLFFQRRGFMSAGQNFVLRL